MMTQLKLILMDKFNCNSDLCVKREMTKSTAFDTFVNGCCYHRIIVGINGELKKNYNDRLMTFFNKLIKKEYLPLNCEVDMWYLNNEGTIFLNFMGYYLDENGGLISDDEEGLPTIDYYIELV